MKGTAIYHSPVGDIQMEYEDGFVTALKNAPEPGAAPEPESAKATENVPEPPNRLTDANASKPAKSVSANVSNPAKAVPANVSNPAKSMPVDDPDPDSELVALVFRQLDEYFAGVRTGFDFPYRMDGTPFQKKVWRALCDIPYGHTRSYKEIAEVIGSPKACRAVGMANHRNPIFIAVPCHRVIGSDGSLTGYGGGLDMKRALLELERKNAGGRSRRTEEREGDTFADFARVVNETKM